MTHCRPEKIQVITKIRPVLGHFFLGPEARLLLGGQGPALEPGPQGSPLP